MSMGTGWFIRIGESELEFSNGGEQIKCWGIERWIIDWFWKNRQRKEVKSICLLNVRVLMMVLTVNVVLKDIIEKIENGVESFVFDCCNYLEEGD